MEIAEAQEPETNAIKAERADWTEHEWLEFFETLSDNEMDTLVKQYFPRSKFIRPVWEKGYKRKDWARKMVITEAQSKKEKETNWSECEWFEFFSRFDDVKLEQFLKRYNSRYKLDPVHGYTREDWASWCSTNWPKSTNPNSTGDWTQSETLPVDTIDMVTTATITDGNKKRDCEGQQKMTLLAATNLYQTDVIGTCGIENAGRLVHGSGEVACCAVQKKVWLHGTTKC